MSSQSSLGSFTEASFKDFEFPIPKDPFKFVLPANNQIVVATDSYPVFVGVCFQKSMIGIRGTTLPKIVSSIWSTAGTHSIVLVGYSRHSLQWYDFVTLDVNDKNNPSKLPSKTRNGNAQLKDGVPSCLWQVGTTKYSIDNIDDWRVIWEKQPYEFWHRNCHHFTDSLIEHLVGEKNTINRFFERF